MAHVIVLDGREYRIVIGSKVGHLVDVDLASLYYISKYGGEKEFLRVRIPEHTNEEGTTFEEITFVIKVEEGGGHECQHGTTCIG